MRPPDATQAQPSKVSSWTCAGWWYGGRWPWPPLVWSFPRHLLSARRWRRADPSDCAMHFWKASVSFCSSTRCARRMRYPITVSGRWRRCARLARLPEISPRCTR